MQFYCCRNDAEKWNEIRNEVEARKEMEEEERRNFVEKAKVILENPT